MYEKQWYILIYYIHRFKKLYLKLKFTILNIFVLCFVTDKCLLLSTEIDGKMKFSGGQFYGKHP